VGVLQQELAFSGSILSQHISSFGSADLIIEWRTLFCIIKYDKLQTVIDFFKKIIVLLSLLIVDLLS